MTVLITLQTTFCIFEKYLCFPCIIIIIWKLLSFENHISLYSLRKTLIMSGNSLWHHIQRHVAGKMTLHRFYM